MIIWEYNVRCSSFFVAIVGPSLSKGACLWSPPGTPLECFAFEAFFENPPVDTTTTSPTSFPRPFSNFPTPGQDLCIGVNLQWEGKCQVSSGSWRARWGKKYVDPYHIHWRIIWWMMVNDGECDTMWTSFTCSFHLRIMTGIIHICHGVFTSSRSFQGNNSIGCFHFNSIVWFVSWFSFQFPLLKTVQAIKKGTQLFSLQQSSNGISVVFC